MLIEDIPVGDLNQLLRGGFVFSKTHGWIYVGEFRDVFLQAWSCDGNIQEIRIDKDVWSKDLELKLPHLGYCNVKGTVVFVKRIPKRVMKAAVDFTNCNCLGLSNLKTAMPGTSAESYVQRIETNLIPMFRGLYPTFEEALEMLKDKEIYAVAYDRQFAIDSDGRVYYCGKRVGNYTPEKGIEYHKQYSYLKFSEGDYHEALQAAKKAARERVGRG